MLAQRLPRPDCNVLMTVALWLQLGSRSCCFLSWDHRQWEQRSGAPADGCPATGRHEDISTLYIYALSTLYIYASHGRYIDVYLELGGWGHWALGSGADCLWCPIVNINTAASSSSWGGAAEGCRHPGLSQHYTTQHTLLMLSWRMCSCSDERINLTLFSEYININF